MPQSYKVFIEDKPLLITEKLIDSNSLEVRTLLASESSKNEIQTVCNRLKTDEFDKAIIISKSAKKTFKLFKECYNLAEAAGGLVIDSEKRYLIMFRNGKWDLPKGKIESGETIKKAAKREVKEECGLKKLKILSPLITTYHTYERKGKSYLKPTYWFMMSIPDTQKGIAQLEEGITELKWVSLDELKKYSKKSYFTIQMVIKEALNRPTP
jgi:8-oxo-dGTP pyrophosphatase MutT (NUDIX family)